MFEMSKYRLCKNNICDLDLEVCDCTMDYCIDCKYPIFMCKCINNNSDLVIELMQDIININKGLKNES